MGDRANIRFKTGSGESDHVFLYTHCGGYHLPGRLQDALRSDAAKSRWNDAPYLCRILIDRIIPEHESALGWGISHSVQDNEYCILDVDIAAQMVVLRTFDAEKWDVVYESPPIGSWTFQEFCDIDAGNSMLNFESLSEIAAQQSAVNHSK